jgi:hypothetical protein
MYIYAREAKIIDIKNIMVLGNKVFKIYSKERSDWIIKNPLNYNLLKYIIKNNSGKIFVAVDDEYKNNILGYCIISIREIKDHHIFKNMTNIEIDDFYVDIKYSENMVEKILFERINEYAKEIGANYIELNVWEFNIT